MLKYLFCLIIFTITFNAAFAQAKGDTLVYYVKDDGKLASDKLDADYVLFILPQTLINNKKLYPAIAYYPNGKLKFSAVSSKQSVNLVLEGPYITYFQNGKRSSMVNVEKGKPVGEQVSYYPNGKLYTRTKHEKGKVRLIDCLDSLGNALTTNGNGEWIIFDNNFNHIVRSFMVKNGFEEAVEITFIRPRNLLAERKLWPGEEKYLAVNPPPVYKKDYRELHEFIVNKLKLTLQDRPLVYGQIYVGFFVEENGSLNDFEVFQSTYNTLSEEIVKLIRTLQPWQPAYKDNKPVRSPFILPIHFYRDSLAIDRDWLTLDITDKSTSIDIETKPEFKGGLGAFTQYLSTNMVYPSLEKKKRVQGKVIISFIVEKDGYLSDLHVLSTPSIGLAEEALRVLRLSPKWIPAKAKGKPLRVRYTIPINFSLGVE